MADVSNVTRILNAIERGDVKTTDELLPIVYEELRLLAAQKLAKLDKVKVELVKLRFFTGLTNEQAAQVLGISHNTADRYWAYARSWLHLEITNGGESHAG
jgi:DNA-directed RNA polymerase specialized sigma24 family protein